MLKKIFLSRWTKVLLFLACLIPAAYLGWRAYMQELGANPVEYITHFTGDWTLRFVAITLSVTPLRELLKQPQLIRFRRMVGLFAFFYGFLHFTTWICLDKWFDWNEMLKDVAKRPFITVGFTGFALMAPLAVTSTAGWVRRLGYVRWERLHRLIYLTAIAGVIHYYWLVKSDVRLPLLYGAIMAALLAYRLARRKPPVRAARVVLPADRRTVPKSSS